MMKKVVAAAIALMCLTTGVAMAADGGKGKIAVTGMLGFVAPADSEKSGSPRLVIDTDTGFGVGGGLLVLLERNIALEFTVNHTGYDGSVGGQAVGSFDVNYYTIGGQYRFASVQQRFTPYAGAGLTFISTDFTRNDGVKADVDTVVGLTLSAGLEYPVTRQLALVAESRFLLAPDADMKVGGTGYGSFDPMNFSMGFGARFFFN